MRSIAKYLFDRSVGHLIGNALVYFFDDPMFSTTKYNDQIIAYLNKDIDDSFRQCSQEALDLIEETNPIMGRVVSKNLKIILGQRPKSKQWLAKYFLNKDMCTINWNGIEERSHSARIQILAGVIVHEAYHGECYKLFGWKAYNLKPCERICRNRESRILNQFILLNSDDDISELSDRINYLEAI